MAIRLKDPVMSEAGQLYDQIGVDYADRRRSDPRWAETLNGQLQGVQRLVNVGAGAGSYEPDDLNVVAVEPAQTMIAQRPLGAAPAICARAEALPFAAGSFDAAMAILTVHHWHDHRAGLAEMTRVARRQLVLTWDRTVFAEAFWLVRDYLPEVAEWERGLATLDDVVDVLGPCRVLTMAVPADFSDGVLGAFWQRPERYLDPARRSAMSGLALLDQARVADATDRLRRDLEDGSWRDRNRQLLARTEFDLGYRLVVAGD